MLWVLWYWNTSCHACIAVSRVWVCTKQRSCNGTCVNSTSVFSLQSFEFSKRQELQVESMSGIKWFPMTTHLSSWKAWEWGNLTSSNTTPVSMFSPPSSIMPLRFSLVNTSTQSAAPLMTDSFLDNKPCSYQRSFSKLICFKFSYI